MPYGLPLKNRISNQSNLQGGIAAIYQWDNSVMDGFSPPAPINRQACLDAIFFFYGEAPLIYNEPEYLKYYIRAWSQKNQTVWAKLYETTTLEYNPIHNYDRTETFTENRQGTSQDDKTYLENINRSGNASDTIGDTRNTTNHGESTDIGNTRSNDTDTNSTETIGQVSAQNVDTFQNDTRQTADTEATRNNITDSTVYTTSDATTDETYSRQASNTWGDDSSRGGTDKTQGQHEETVTNELHAFGNIGATTTQQMIEAQRDIVDYRIEDVIARSFHKEFCISLW